MKGNVINSEVSQFFESTCLPRKWDLERDNLAYTSLFCLNFLRQEIKLFSTSQIELYFVNQEKIFFIRKV